MSDLNALPPDFQQRCDNYRAFLQYHIYESGNIDQVVRSRLEEERKRIGLSKEDARQIEEEYLRDLGLNTAQIPAQMVKGRDLPHFYRGKFVEQGKVLTRIDFNIIAWSPSSLNPDNLEHLFMQANFGSYNAVSNLESLRHGYGLFRCDEETYVLTHVRPGSVKDRGHLIPYYHCILIPSDLLIDLAGNLRPLINLLGNEPHPPTFRRNSPSPEKVRLEDFRPLSAWEKEQALAIVYESFRDQVELFGQLLTALLQQQSVAIINAPTDPTWRLEFIQALWLTLPPAVCDHITFATEVFESDKCTALVKFLYNDYYARGGNNDVHLFWGSDRLNRNISPHPYAEFLVSNWDHGPIWLVDNMPQWSEQFAAITANTQVVSEAMAILGYRLQLLQQIEQGIVKPKELVEVIRTDPTLTDSQIRDFSLSLLYIAVERGQLELMDVVIERGVVSNLADDLDREMIRLSKQGFGERVYKLLQRWLQKPANSGIDLDYWNEVVQEVRIIHVNYLIDQNTEQSILASISTIRSMAESLKQEVLSDFIIKLSPVSGTYAKVALEYFSLVVCYDYESLLNLLKDREARQKWPSQLRTVATYISGPNFSQAPNPRALVQAAQALKRERDQEIAFVSLAFLAIKQGRVDLMDTASWQFLQTISAKHEWGRENAIRLSKLLTDADWIKQLRSDNAIFELVKLRLALSDYPRAVSLLRAIQVEYRDESNRFAAQVGLLCQTSATDSDGALAFLREMSSNFAPTITIEACIGFLNKFNWTENDIVDYFANFLYQHRHHPKVILNELYRLELLSALIKNRQVANPVIDYQIKQALEQAWSKDDYQLITAHLNEIVIRIEKLKMLRERMSQYVRSYANTLSLEQLQSFHNELRKYQLLSGEAKAINAQLTLARVLGHQSLAQFAHELNTVAHFLHRLEKAFHQDGSSEFDWATFESHLSTELGELDQEGWDRVAQQCLYLAEAVGRLGDARTKKSFFNSQSKIDQKLKEGTMAPQGAVDALKRLAGFFERSRR